MVTSIFLTYFPPYVRPAPFGTNGATFERRNVIAQTELFYDLGNIKLNTLQRLSNLSAAHLVYTKCFLKFAIVGSCLTYHKIQKKMISKAVENLIPKIQLFFVGQPVKKAWIFGSCSRGEETPESDVDILVEYDREKARISLMTISSMMIRLEDILQRKVDIIEKGRLLPFAAETADKDKFLIYERKNQG